MELSQDITEDDLVEANNILDKDTLKVSDQSEAFGEAFETHVDDDGEILISYKLSSLKCFSVLV